MGPKSGSGRTHVEQPAVDSADRLCELALLRLVPEPVVLAETFHDLGDEQLGSDRMAVGRPAEKTSGCRRTYQAGGRRSASERRACAAFKKVDELTCSPR